MKPEPRVEVSTPGPASPEPQTQVKNKERDDVFVVKCFAAKHSLGKSIQLLTVPAVRPKHFSLTVCRC